LVYERYLHLLIVRICLLRMTKHAEGSAKWISAKMKGRGLSKLKYYCQMCEKQCRDANGFKCHQSSESHKQKMKLFLEDPEKFTEEFSEQFEDQFLAELESHSRDGTEDPWLGANEVYAGVVRERDHVHLNATKWETFTDFVEYLTLKGVVRKRVDAHTTRVELQRIDTEKEERLAKQIEEDRKREERIKLVKEREQRDRFEKMKAGFNHEQVSVTVPTSLERKDPSEKVQIKFGGGVANKRPKLDNNPWA
jgi:DNA/RNA-binding protein KIN17